MTGVETLLSILFIILIIWFTVIIFSVKDISNQFALYKKDILFECSHEFKDIKISIEKIKDKLPYDQAVPSQTMVDCLAKRIEMLEGKTK